MNDKPHGGTLNVIFHGSITLYEDKASFLAMLPENKALDKSKSDPHAFRAGNWLGETELNRGDYELRGVNPGQASFDVQEFKEKNLLLPKKGLNTKGARVTIKLDRPQKITSLRIATMQLNALAGKDRQMTVDAQVREDNTVKLATVHVFTYSFDDDNELLLADIDPQKIDGHYWEPVSTGGYVNLHVFCSEDRSSTPTQAAADFSACAQLLDFDLTMTRPVPTADAVEGDLPDGVLAEELEDLPFRTLRMALLGRLFKQDGDTNLAWAANDSLSCPDSCGPLCG